MEISASIVLLAPILAPLAQSLGIHPLHFAMIMLINLNIGLITPPLGQCIFTVCGITNLKMEQVVTVLQRCYDVEVNVANEAIMSCSVTSLYFENEPLDTVLAGLEYVMHLGVEQPSDSVVVFTGEGCNR